MRGVVRIDCDSHLLLCAGSEEHLLPSHQSLRRLIRGCRQSNVYLRHLCASNGTGIRHVERHLKTRATERASH